jgi:hypothetical protein
MTTATPTTTLSGVGIWPRCPARQESAPRQRIPRNFPRTIPTPPDETDTTAQDFFDSRMIPTSPDGSNHPHPSFNPKVPGSRPGRPTSKTQGFRAVSPFRVLKTGLRFIPRILLRWGSLVVPGVTCFLVLGTPRESSGWKVSRQRSKNCLPSQLGWLLRPMLRAPRREIDTTFP